MSITFPPITDISEADNANYLVDSASRLKTVNPVGLFDSRFPFDKQAAFWDEKTVGTGSITHEANTASVVLSVAAAGDRAIKQTREYMHYQSGKTHVSKLTYFPDGAAENAAFVVRSKGSGSVVDTVINRADWNVDKMDGTGQSQIELDITKAQCLWIDFIPGTGSFGFVIDRQLHYCHIQAHANKDISPFISNPSLPLRYEIYEDNGTIYQNIGYFDDEDGLFMQLSYPGTSGTLKARCVESVSEGGYRDEPGIIFAPSTGATPINLASGATTYIAVRHSELFHGKRNVVKFEPIHYSITSQDEMLFTRVVYKPTITGGTWVPFAENIYTSAMELNTGITSISGGLTLDSTYVLASGQGVNVSSQELSADFVSKLPFGRGIDNDDPIALLLEITNLGAAATDVTYALKWKEVQT
jgi:hypothetical protein